MTDSKKETPWMEWLRANIGQHEIKGKENNPFIVNLFNYTSYQLGNDETPWCAATICAALEKNGYESPHRADAKSFDEYGEPCELEYGAIITLRHPDGSRHVTCFFSPIPAVKSAFLGLGGNQENALKVSQYVKAEIVSVRRPVKKAAPLPVPAPVKNKKKPATAVAVEVKNES